MDLEKITSKIKDKEDFEMFLEALIKDFSENKDEWENKSLKDFLKALKSYTTDLEGYYKNWNIKYDLEKPSWKMFSNILLGAKIYE